MNQLLENKKISYLPRRNILCKDRIKSNDFRSAILINYSELNENFEIQKIKEQFNSDCILDFRISPKLDKFASTRARVFDILNTQNITYIDTLGILNINNIDDFKAINHTFIDELSFYIKKHIHKDRSFICIFDDENIFEKCRNILNNKNLEHFWNRIEKQSARFKMGFLSL